MGNKSTKLDLGFSTDFQILRSAESKKSIFDHVCSFCVCVSHFSRRLERKPLKEKS